MSETKEQVKPAASSEGVAQRSRAQPKPGALVRNQWVRALDVGYIDHNRVRQGQEIQIAPEEFTSKWMVAIKGPGEDADVGRSEELEKAVNAKRIDEEVRREEARIARRGRLMPADASELRKSLQAENDAAMAKAGFGQRVPGASRAHPDTGSAPSSGIGTNLNPAPYGQDKVDKAKGASIANKNVI
jgi:hypothetical protein